MAHLSYTYWARHFPDRTPLMYSNNAQCTFTVLESTYLSVVSFSTEPGTDYLTVGRTQYSGTTGPTGVSVTTGSTITWYSDGSIANSGFTICGGGSPAPTQPFSVTASTPTSTSCFTTNSGTCFSNGLRSYQGSDDDFSSGDEESDNERCVINVNQNVVLRVVNFTSDPCCDFMTVNGLQYSGVTGPSGVLVSAGSNIRWSTGSSGIARGFAICTGDVNHPTSNSPTTAAPIPALTSNPTQQNTVSPTLPTSRPMCLNNGVFDGPFGSCSDYGPNGFQQAFCGTDTSISTGLTASVICAECGLCVDSVSVAPSYPPTSSAPTYATPSVSPTSAGTSVGVFQILESSQTPSLCFVEPPGLTIFTSRPSPLTLSRVPCALADLTAEYSQASRVLNGVPSVCCSRRCCGYSC